MSADLARWTDGLAEGRRGTLVQEKRERRVWRVEEGGRAAFAKRGTGAKRREVRREAENARVLARAGFGPRVLAAGARDGAEWLVTEDASATGHPLGIALRLGPARPLAERLGAAIRRFHDAGFDFPDLTRDHVWVADDGLRLVDAARLVRRRSPAPDARRARDLAALLFSLHCAVVVLSRADRLRLVRAATARRGDTLRAVCRAIDREIARLCARTRWRHGHWACTPAFAAALPGNSRECWHVGMEAILSPRSWRIVRTLPDRQNRVLCDASGRPLYFGKRFPPTARGGSPAMREIAAIDRFQRAGVPVNRLAAYCEDLDEGSLVAVAACAGEPLDDFLRRGVPRAERRALAEQTARIWRRMRHAGLRHRDAYACHLFVARTADPRRHELRLIDLTRAGEAPFPRERWFVKDAAQLWHGARPAGATRTDAVAWLRAYFGVRKLSREAKRFARRVAAKEASIEARQRRKRGGA